MKYKTFVSFVLATVFIMTAINQAWAIQARLRILFALGGTSTIDGFEDETVLTSEVGLAILTPLTRDIGLGVGYSYFWGGLEENNDVSFQNHQLLLSADYTGIELSATQRLLLGVGLNLPLAGSAEVKIGSETESTNKVGGAGIFLAAGVVQGHWEFIGYYLQKEFTYDISVPSTDGSQQDLAIHINEYGIGVGYLF